MLPVKHQQPPEGGFPPQLRGYGDMWRLVEIERWENSVCPRVPSQCPAHFLPPLKSLSLFLLSSNSSIEYWVTSGFQFSVDGSSSMCSLPSSFASSLITGGKVLSFERHCGRPSRYWGLRKDTSSETLDQEKCHLKRPKLTKLSLEYLLSAHSH